MKDFGRLLNGFGKLVVNFGGLLMVFGIIRGFFRYGDFSWFGYGFLTALVGLCAVAIGEKFSGVKADD